MYSYQDSAEWRKAVTEVYDEMNETYTGGHMHLAKRKATLEAMVEADMLGYSLNSVFERPETCTKTVWYKKWRHDPVMEKALEALRTLMFDMQDQEVAMALQVSKRRLALLTPDAVDRLEEFMGPGVDEAITIRAVKEILDRGGLETAAKSVSSHSVTMEPAPNDDEMEQFYKWQEEKKPVDDK